MNGLQRIIETNLQGRREVDHRVESLTPPAVTHESNMWGQSALDTMQEADTESMWEEAGCGLLAVHYDAETQVDSVDFRYC